MGCESVYILFILQKSEILSVRVRGRVILKVCWIEEESACLYGKCKRIGVRPRWPKVKNAEIKGCGGDLEGGVWGVLEWEWESLILKANCDSILSERGFGWFLVKLDRR